MPDLGLGELLIVALVAFAIFGYKRLPDAARSLGRSMRIFKAETRGLAPGDVRGKAEAPTVRGWLGDRTAPGNPDPGNPDPDPGGTDRAGTARAGTNPAAATGDAGPNR
jgi:TatA/E family protein of Tat protein translocase